MTYSINADRQLDLLDILRSLALLAREYPPLESIALELDSEAADLFNEALASGELAQLLDAHPELDIDPVGPSDTPMTWEEYKTYDKPLSQLAVDFSAAPEVAAGTEPFSAGLVSSIDPYTVTACPDGFVWPVQPGALPFQTLEDVVTVGYSRRFVAGNAALGFSSENVRRFLGRGVRLELVDGKAKLDWSGDHAPMFFVKIVDASGTKEAVVTAVDAHSLKAPFDPADLISSTDIHGVSKARPISSATATPSRQSTRKSS